MEYLVKVKLEDGTWELVNEMQICRIRQENKVTFLHLSNGEIMGILEPPFDQWENDLFVRR